MLLNIRFETTGTRRPEIPEYSLRQLHYFVAAAEAGTSTEAAEALHLSQSAMSTALADLEKAFQVQLLVRHHARGTSLTPAGRELLVASRQLPAQAADLLGAAEGLGSSLTGTGTSRCAADELRLSRRRVGQPNSEVTVKCGGGGFTYLWRTGG
jgi:DNA-binding transcriptional LysR family regulator